MALFIPFHAGPLVTLIHSVNSVTVVGFRVLDDESSDVSDDWASSGPNQCDGFEVACWAARSRSYSQLACRLPMGHAGQAMTPAKISDRFPYRGEAFQPRQPAWTCSS
jgi:hypothetical protein